MLRLSVLLLVLLSSSEESPFRRHLHRNEFKRLSSAPIKQEHKYRLPHNVVPLHYDLNLKLEEDAFDSKTFSGVASIEVRTIEPAYVVMFHAKDMEITNLEIRKGDDLLNATWSGIDPESDIVRAETETELTPDSLYSLTIWYSGILSETAYTGFYQSSYYYNGSEHHVASTDFEPTNARKAFPCFDEPAMKATFDLTLTFPQGYSALANTPIVADLLKVPGTNLRQTTFATTPLMSTYLIAFVVSEFDCTEATGDPGIRSEVCSRQGTENTRETAVSAAPDVLRIMKNYTHYDYGTSRIGKLTQIAIPDYMSGAMENWGLVVYREDFLLWDEEESPSDYKQDVVATVAHELSHQWFGDLVTLDWWSDVFLNEGFATYFEYYATDEIFPEWEIPKQFVIQQLQTAMVYDSNDDSAPLSNYVEVQSDIDDRFDYISYNKGGSVLRMVRYFLGLDNFKAGLIDYIEENQFSTSTPSILWKSFEKYAQSLPEPEKPPVPMEQVMANWTYKAGYPTVKVTRSGGDVTVSQSHIPECSCASNCVCYSDTKWYIPLTYTLEDKSSSDTATQAWLTPDKDLELVGVLANSSWIVLNNQEIGYYRVDYDDQLWQEIVKALSEPGFSGIDVLNRAQIVDDLFSFVNVGLKNYSRVLDLLSFLKNEDEYFPWYPAFSFFNYLLRRINDQELRETYKAHVLNLMEKLYASVPFSSENPDDLIYTMKQALALDWACFLSNEDCATNCRRAFADFREKSLKPSINLKSIVYCNGLRYSENPSTDFDFLWQKYLGSTKASEQGVILESLGCISDEEVLNMYLEKSITDDGGIQAQDVYTAWSSVYTSGPTGVDIVLDFLTNNYQKFVDHFGGTDDLQYLLYLVANRFTSRGQVDKLQSFINNAELDEEMKSSLSTALHNAGTNLELTAIVENELRNYFGL